MEEPTEEGMTARRMWVYESKNAVVISSLLQRLGRVNEDVR
jgi:hypothetical protein